MAAVLACGEGAALSHGPAAALWGLLPADPGAVDVSVCGDGGRQGQRGIRLHRSRSLTSEHTTRPKGIPVTIPARTISDLRRTLPSELVRKAIRQAEVIGFGIGGEDEADLTRSELEGRFLALCRRHRLPVPDVNARIGRYVVDFIWRGQHLIVETDGYRYHRGRQAFEDDRARDIDLRLLGYEVIRFTYRQVVDDPARVVRTLRALL